MPARAREIITALNLQPLPHEGGFFRVTWRSDVSSAILFLLTPEDFSALHRLGQEELWHFHAGDPVELLRLDPRDGTAGLLRLGADVRAGEAPQAAVPAGTWQGARLAPERVSAGFALLGCTVVPPWDERRFELGARADLAARFPGHAAIIAALTR